jgi:hypothetical protein
MLQSVTVPHACNYSYGEVEVGRSPARGQPYQKTTTTTTKTDVTHLNLQIIFIMYHCNWNVLNFCSIQKTPMYKMHTHSFSKILMLLMFTLAFCLFFSLVFCVCLVLYCSQSRIWQMFSFRSFVENFQSLLQLPKSVILLWKSYRFEMSVSLYLQDKG